jgi:hypothetical protein
VAVTLELQAAGNLASGVVSPSAGASIKITPTPKKALTLSIDYSSPDQLVVSAVGTMKIEHTGLGISGGIDTNLLTGKADFTGKASYTISKNVSAVLSGSLGASGPKASAGISIQFG